MTLPKSATSPASKNESCAGLSTNSVPPMNEAFEHSSWERETTSKISAEWRLMLSSEMTLS
jgi:hypothetical protein